MSNTEAAQHWSAVATAWDTHVDELDEHTGPTLEALLQRVAVQRGERVLELAAGPGSLGGTWSALVGDTGTVLLSDIAPAMVETARRRTAGLANVQHAVLDASAIDQPDGAHDVVVCRMGLMFTPDPAVALGEIHRVLAPGGRFAALTWAGLEHNPWMTCIGMAAGMNGVTQGGPPVGPGGIFSLGDPAHVGALVDGAGFTEVEVVPIDITLSAPDVDSHIRKVLSLAGPLAVALEHASPEQRAAVHRDAAALAAPHMTADGLRIPGRALLAFGRVG